MRLEQRTQPRFEHIWQGWSSRIRSVVEIISLTDGEYLFDEDAPVTGRVVKFHSWPGFKELLFPTCMVDIHVPVGETVWATAAHTTPGEVTFGVLDFGSRTPLGTFTHLQMTDEAGTVLAEIGLTAPITIAELGSSMTVMPTFSLS